MPNPPQVFEMFWDCEFCGAAALLGKTNRYCPQCGAPQNPDKRYFPPPGKEVRANTTFEGTDKACPACQTPNGARANNCRHCGSPLDGSKEVRKLADRVEGLAAPAPKQAAPPPGPKKASRAWAWILGGVGAVASLCLSTMLWTKESTVTVAGHAWSRSIEVETFGPVQDSAWCDAMPSDAYGVSRRREQRGTEKVADGEVCKTRDVDRGDGTFERREECSPKFRETPVYDDKCSFTVDRWKVVRTERASGEALSPPPQWPPVHLARTGACRGCEREGARKEHYEVKLSTPEGSSDTCAMPEAKWAGFAVGRSIPVKVRVIGGGVDCSTLGP